MSYLGRNQTFTGTSKTNPTRRGIAGGASARYGAGYMKIAETPLDLSLAITLAKAVLYLLLKVAESLPVIARLNSAPCLPCDCYARKWPCIERADLQRKSLIRRW